MKPTTEQVDQFIEDLFNGSIITLLHEKVDAKGETPISASALILGASPKGGGARAALGQLSTNLLTLVMKYVEPSTENKDVVAREIFILVWSLRFSGIIQNNPNNLKELNFYKDRSKMLEGELRESQEQASGYLSTIRKLQAEIAGKGGVA